MPQEKQKPPKDWNLEEEIYALSKIIEQSIEGNWTGIIHTKWRDKLYDILAEEKIKLFEKHLRVLEESRQKSFNQGWKRGQEELKKELKVKEKKIKEKIEFDKVENLASCFHQVYQEELKRQGKESKYSDFYTELPEDIKDLDRALAKYVLELLAQEKQKWVEEIDKKKWTFIEGLEISEKSKKAIIRIHNQELEELKKT